MMRRRYQQEQPHNHDRWLVSYADFITLLFAFFVVMYSLSSVNEGKYRVLANSLDSAFRTTRPAQVMPADAAVYPAPVLTAASFAPNPDMPFAFSLPPGEVPVETVAPVVEEVSKDDSFNQRVLARAEGEISAIGDEVESNFTELVEDDMINIKRNKFWLEVEIKSNLLFPSGSSDLLNAALPVLEDLSRMFVDKPNRINIEGFTDNVPINTTSFPSNWELSASRAATVVRLFEKNGVDPKRMASIGYGEHQPISENESEEGRARNRRVVMVVMADVDGREGEKLYEFDPLRSKPAIQ
jgi:chemotaxis protein MotB